MSEISLHKDTIKEEEETSHLEFESKIIDGIIYNCPIEDHEEQPLNMVCLYEECPKRGLHCVNCFMSDHYSHIKSCVSIKVFLNGLKTSMNTTEDFKKQEKQLESVNEKFDEVFAELKKAKDEFEDCFARLEANFRFFHTRLNDHMKQYQLDSLKESVKKLEEKSFKSVNELDHEVYLLIEHTNYNEQNPKHLQVMPIKEQILLLRKNYRDLASGLIQLRKFIEPITKELEKAPVFQEFNEDFEEVSLESYRSDRSQEASEGEIDADHSSVGSNEESKRNNRSRFGSKDKLKDKSLDDAITASNRQSSKPFQSSIISRFFNEKNAAAGRDSGNFQDLADVQSNSKKGVSNITKSQLELDSELKKVRAATQSLDLRPESKSRGLSYNTGGDSEKNSVKKLDGKPNAGSIVKSDQAQTNESSMDTKISSYLKAQLILLFDPRKMKCSVTLQERSSCQINTIILLNDNKTILTGNNKGQVNAWNYLDGSFVKAVLTLEAQVCGLLSLHDGERFVVACANGELEIYDYFSEQCLYTLKDTKSWITALVYFEDFTTIASAGKEACIQFWDINSGQEIAKIEDAHKEWIWSLVYLKDNESLVSSGGDGAIKVWNYKTQQLVRQLGNLNTFVLSSVYVKTSNLLVFGGTDGIIKVLNAETGSVLYNLIGHKGRVNSLTPLGNGDYLASASEDKTIRIWSLKNGSHLLKLSGHEQKVCSVIALEDQITLVSNSWDKTVKIWSSATKK